MVELIGIASVEKSAVGLFILIADNSYTSGTEVAGGTLQRGDGHRVMPPGSCSSLYGVAELKQSRTWAEMVNRNQ